MQNKAFGLAHCNTNKMDRHYLVQKKLCKSGNIEKIENRVKKKNHVMEIESVFVEKVDD